MRKDEGKEEGGEEGEMVLLPEPILPTHKNPGIISVTVCGGKSTPTRSATRDGSGCSPKFGVYTVAKAPHLMQI